MRVLRLLILVSVLVVSLFYYLHETNAMKDPCDYEVMKKAVEYTYANIDELPENRKLVSNLNEDVRIGFLLEKDKEAAIRNALKVSYLKKNGCAI